MRLLTFMALGALAALAAGCHSDAGPPRPHSHPVDMAEGLVLADRSHGPELCLGPVMQSDPPQCHGIPLDGWDWDKVEGETVNGTTTTYAAHITGQFDGKRFFVSEAGPNRGGLRHPTTTDRPTGPKPSPAELDRIAAEVAGDKRFGVVSGAPDYDAGVVRFDVVMLTQDLRTRAADRWHGRVVLTGLIVRLTPVD